MLKVLELFGGIGACSKALCKLGIDYEIVDYVEIDKFAVKSFNAIHNTNFEPQDITKWNKDIKADLIMHGSPCQDFSTNGKNEGGDKGSGTRSSLMYETIRIVKKIKPKYVVWENVKNLLSKRHIHNFENYLHELSNLGYSNYYKILNAKDYGIPQNRERVFVVSILGNENFEFPEKQKLSTKLIDLLEKEVDEKYYLSDEQINKLKVNSDHQRMLLRNATKKGYLEAEEGDSVDLEFPESKTKRGRIGKQIAKTLLARDNLGVVIGSSVLLTFPKTPKSRIMIDIARTITTRQEQGVFTE